MRLHSSTSHLPLCIQSGTLGLSSSRFLKWLSPTCPEVCLLSNSKSSQADNQDENLVSVYSMERHRRNVLNEGMVLLGRAAGVQSHLLGKASSV